MNQLPGIVCTVLLLCGQAAWAESAQEKMQLADTLMKQGSASSALHFYDQAVDLNPNFYLAYLRRGDALMKLGQRRFALDDYRKALKLNPGCPEVLRRLNGTSSKSRKHSHKSAKHSRAQ